MIDVIDSHTGGEPTRVVIAGGPSLPLVPLAERVAILRRDHDAFRSCVVNEPRGSDVLVGGLLVEPCDPTCTAGIIFFNNVGYLGMCGHGTIGLMTTLAHLGRITPGRHRIETPVGIITTQLHSDGRCSVHNVPSYRHVASVSIDVLGVGRITGDIAWGGNWFFLVQKPSFTIRPAEWEKLTSISRRIREALEVQGITGADGAVIDHIELFSPSATADSRNFVLCPGMAYDRSPCGTGTSAKIACLAADGKLAPGQLWRQESIIGSVFEATYEWAGDTVLPTITGRAFITGEVRLIVQADDPFAMGITTVGD